MAIRIVNVNGDVNAIPAHLAAAIRNEVSIVGLGRLTYGSYDGGSSDNWDDEASPCDVANIVYGRPSSYPLSEILDWIDKSFTPSVGHDEKEFLSFIYTRHSFPPILALWGLLRKLSANRGGDPEIDKRVAVLRAWLRAYLGWGVLTSFDGAVRGFKSAEATAPPHRAQVLTSSGDLNQRWGPVACVAAGRRGWVKEDGVWMHGGFPHFLSGPVAEFACGRVMGEKAMDVAQALRDIGIDTSLLTADEQARCRAAIRDSIPDLQWALAVLVGPYLPAYPYRVIRTRGGITTIVLSAGGSPTSTLVAVTAVYDGELSAGARTARLYLCGTDDGIRGTGTEKHINGHEVYGIDMDRRVLNARQVEEKKGEGIKAPQPPVVGMPIAPGEILMDFEAHVDSGVRWHVGAPPKPIEPETGGGGHDGAGGLPAPSKRKGKNKKNNLTLILGVLALLALAAYLLNN